MSKLIDLLNLVKIAEEYEYKRTIANFRLITEEKFIKDHELIYYEIMKLLDENNSFNYILNNIFEDNKYFKDIKELKFCNITSKENKTVIILNESIIQKIVNNEINKQKKNNKIIINYQNKNNNKNELYTKYILERKNNINSYTKKRNNKKKSSIKIWKQTEFSNNVKINNYRKVETENHSSEIKSISENEPYIIKNNYILTIFLNEDKIITSGRIMLPTTIAVSLFDESRITIHKNKYIQIIPSKIKNENFILFREKIKNILNILYFLFKIIIERNSSIFSKKYKELIYNNYYNINNNNLDIDVKINFNCDFNYVNMENKNIIFPIINKKYSNNIKLSQNSISLKNILNKDDFLEKIKYINEKINNFNIITNKIYDYKDNLLFLQEDKIKDILYYVYKNELKDKIYFL